MTWNLEWFYDDDSDDNYSKLAKEKSSPSRAEWDWKRDAIAQRIAQVQPSLLAFQEVENRRVLWYLTRALTRNHMLEYDELGIESRDHFTEQDVGMLFRPPVECLSLIQGQLTKRMKSTNQFSDVTKHILGVYEFTSGDVTEEVIVMNVHLRSRPEGESIRRKQARLLQTWIAPYVREGKNVIVLGDFNTEVKGDVMRKESDIGIAAGLETDDPSDDLVDLHLRIPSAERGTHLLEGRQFDRILCSRSLIEDDPSRKDLVFEKAEVLRKLTIQGQKDTEEEHWESYWKLPADQRDLSDHCPVMATFRMR